MNILLATTNPAKTERYSSYFHKINPALKIETLSTYGKNLPEPVESGKNELENSQIKANYYLHQTKFDGLVFAEDTGMTLLGVSEADNPKKDIKKPVFNQFGNIDPGNMVKYYSDLAQKYGGRITQEWVYGFTLASSSFSKSAQVKSTSFLVSKIKGPIETGFPLGAICLIDSTGAKYWNELNEQEKFDFFDHKTILKIQQLLTAFLI